MVKGNRQSAPAASAASTLAGRRRRSVAERLLAGTALCPVSRGLPSAVLAVALLAHGGALANPQGGTVAAGSAQIVQSAPKTLEINQQSQRAVIDWKSFNINADEATRFNQPGRDSVTLNRINDPNPSRIYGSLSANGQIVIVNSAGVLFGPTSHVDVGGIVTSTADITNGNFMAGRMVFDQPGRPNATIVNEGTISVREGGLAAFVAPGVQNSGVIEAKLGKAELASGQTFTLDLYGDNLVKLAVDDKTAGQLVGPDGKPLAARVDNTGRITADGGAVYLTVNAAKGVVDNLINAGGVVQARSAEMLNGKIVLRGDGGRVQVAGTLDASGRDTGATGGTVKVLGDEVAVRSTATIDVSGAAGGGTALVGGNFQGKGAEPNATKTAIATGATIKADAIEQGDGGKIVVWSDGTTAVGGKLSARGGRKGGNGGRVETSGKKRLVVADTVSVDTRAPKGRTGTWLLDPHDITIAAVGTANLVDADAFADAPAADVTIAASTINAANSSVVLQANNDITLNAGAAISIAANGVGLTMQAGRSIALNDSISTTNGNVTLVANETAANGVVSANRDAGAAAIMLAGDKTISTGTGAISITLASGAGLANATSGDITLGNLKTTGGAVSVANNGPNGGSISIASIGTSGGNVDLTSGANGSVSATGAIVTSGGAGGANAGSVTVTGGTGVALAAITAKGADAPGGAGGTVAVSTTTGSIALSGDISTAGGAGSGTGAGGIGGGITINGAAVLGASVALTSTGGGASAGGAISFGSTIDGSGAGGQNLTLTAGMGDVTLSGAVGTNTQLGAVQVASAKDVTLRAVRATSVDVASSGALGLNGAIDATGGFTQTGASSVTLAGDITTSNAGISFGSAITLTGDVTLSSGGGAITLPAIDGAQALTVAAGAGTVAFNGALGAGTVLASLDLTAGIGTSFDQAIHTTGETRITAGGDAGLSVGTAAPGTLALADMALGSISSGSLTLRTTGAGAITVDGVTSGGTANVGGVTLASTGTGTIDFVNSASSFAGALAATNGGTLTVAAGANVTAASFAQNGTGAVSLAGNVTASNAGISFASGASLGASVTLSAAGDITLASVTGGGNDLTLKAGATRAVSVTGAATGIGTLDAAGATITLSDAGNDFGTVALAGVSASVTDGNALALGATNLSGALTLAATGAVTQSAAISVGSLAGSAGSLALENGSNAVGALAGFTTGTGFSLVTGAGGLDVTTAAVQGGTGAVSIVTGGALGVGANVTTTNNAITLAGAGVALAGGVTVNGGSGTLTVNAGAGTFSTGAGTLALGTGTIGVTADHFAIDAASQIGGTAGAAGSADAVNIAKFTAGAFILDNTATASLDAIRAANVSIGNSASGGITIGPYTPAATFATNSLSLTSGDSVTIAGALDLGSRTLNLTAHTDITQSVGAVITAGTLTANAATGGVSLGEANRIDTLGASSAGSGFTLADSNGGLVVSGTVSGGAGPASLSTAGGDLTVSAAVGGATVSLASTDGAIALGADVTAGTGATLSAGTSIARTAGTVSGTTVSLTTTSGSIAADVNAGTLTGSAGTNATLTGAVGTLADFGTASGFSLTDGTGGLSVAGVVHGGTGAASIATSGGALALTGTVDGANVSLAASDDAITLAGTVTTAGTLTLTANDATHGGVSQTAGAISAGTATVDVGTKDVALTAGDNDFGTFGAVGGSVAVKDGNALVLGAVTAANLDVTTSGAITQSGTLVVAGTTTLTAGAGNDVTLNGSSNNFGTVALVSAKDVVLVDTSAIILGASTVSGALSVTAGGAVTQSGALAVSGAATVNAGANSIALTDTGNDFSSFAAAGGSVAVTDATGIVLGTTTAASLSVTAGGAVTQNAALVVTGTTMIDAAGHAITLTSATNDFTGFAATGAAVQVTDANAIALGATAAASLTVNAGGAVTQTGALNVAGTASVNAGSNAITLANASNDFGTFGATGGAVTVRDANALVLGTTNAASLDVTTAGPMTQSGTVVVSGATSLNAGAANDIALNGPGNDFGTVSIISGRNVALADINAIDLGASSISGTLGIVAGGAVTQSGALAVAGATTVDASVNDITLTSASNDFATLSATGGTVAVTDATGIVLGATTASNLTVTAGGGVTQSGALLVAGTTFVNAAGQTIALADTSNDFGTFGAVGTEISVGDANALVLGTTAATNLTVSAGGNVTQSGALVVTGATNVNAGTHDVTLTGIGNDFGTFGATGANVSVVDANAIALADVTATGALRVVAGGNVTQALGTSLSAGSATIAAGAHDIVLANAGNDFGTFAATGANVTVRDANDLVLGATTATGALAVTVGGDLSQAADTAITASTLTGAAGGFAALANGGNEVATLGSFSTGTGFALTDASGGLTVTGPVSATTSGDVVLATTGSLQVNGAATAAGNAVLVAGGGSIGLNADVTAGTTVALSATDASAGTITQTSGRVAAANLLVQAGQSVSLASTTNDVATLAANVADTGAAFAYTDATGFAFGSVAGVGAVAGASGAATVNGNITATATSGALTVAQAVNAGTATATLTATSGSIVGGATIKAGAATLDAGGGIGVGTAVSTDTTGALSLTSRGAGAAGNITVVDANALDTSRLTVVTDVATAQQVSLTSTAGPITLGADLGSAAARDDIALTAASGDIVGGAGTLVARSLTLTAASGSIGAGTVLAVDASSLGGSASGGAAIAGAVGTLAGFTTGTGFSLADASGGLAVSGAVQGGTGPVSIATTGGTLTIGADVTTANNTIAFAGDGVGIAAGATVNGGTGALSVNARTGALSAAAGARLLGTGTISLTSDDFQIDPGARVGGDGSLTAADFAMTVSLAQFTDGHALDLTGANASLDTIHAANVAIGNGASGALTIGPYTPAATFATNSLSLTSGGAITVAGALDLGARTLQLAAGTDIAQSTGAVITAATLTANAATGAVNLGEANRIGVLGASSAGTSFTLVDAAGGLSVTGAVAAGGAMAIQTTGGALSLVGTGSVSGTDVALTAIDNAIALAGNITATGLLTLAASDATHGGVSQSGGAIIAAGATVQAGSRDVTLNQAANDFGTFAATGGTVTVRDANGIDLGATNAANLTVTAVGNVTQSGALGVSGTTVINAAGHDVSLADATNDFGTFRATAANVAVGDANDIVLGATVVTDALQIDAAGAVTQSAAISAGTLRGSAGSLTLQDAGNAIGTLGAFSTGNGFALVDGSGGLSITGAVQGGATSTVSIRTTGGDLALGAAGSVSGGTVALTATDHAITLAGTIGAGTLTLAATDATNGGVSQSGGAITATNASVSAGTRDVTLNRAGNDFGTFAATGGIVGVTDANALVLGTIGAAALSVTAGGPITQNGAATVGGASSFTTTAGNAPITLDNAGNALTGGVTLAANGTGAVTLVNTLPTTLALSSYGGNLDIAAAGAISYTGTLNVAGNVALTNGAGGLTLGPIGAGGSLAVTAAGPIAQTGAFAIAGASSFTTTAGNGSATLDAAGNEFGGAVSFRTHGTGGATLVNNVATQLDASTIGGDFAIASVNGAVTQTGALVVAGATTVNAGAHDVTLTVAGNDFGTFAATGGNVSVRDANAVALGATTATGTLAVTAGGNVTQSGTIVAGTLTGSAAGSAVLTNGGNNVGTLGTFSTGTGFALTDGAGGLTVTGPVQTTTSGDVVIATAGSALQVTGGIAAAGNVALTSTDNAIALGADLVAGTTVGLSAADGITQTAGKVQATNLLVRAGKSVALTSSTNDVTTLAASVTGAGETFAYADASGLTLGSVTSVAGIAGASGLATSGDAALRATALTLAGDLNVGANDLQLQATTGGATQSSGAITAGGLLVVAAGDTALTSSTNDVGTIAASVAAGGFSFRNANGFTVGSATAGVPSLGLSRTGITTGGVDADDHDVALIAGNGGATEGANRLTLAAGVDTRGAGGIGAAADVLLQTASGVNAGGNLVEAAGGAMFARGLLVRSAGLVDFTQANEVETLAAAATGGLAFNDAAGLTVGTVSVSAPSGASTAIADSLTGVTAGGDAALTATSSLTLSGNIDVGAGSLQLQAAAGGVTQAAGTIAAGKLLIVAAGDTALNSAGNDVGTIAAEIAGGGFSYSDANGLTVGSATVNAPSLNVAGGKAGVVAGGVSVDDHDIALVTGGTLTLAANVDALGGGTVKGDVLLRSTGGAVTATAGAVTARGLLIEAASASALNGANDVDALAASVTAGGFGFSNIAGFDVAAVSVGAPGSVSATRGGVSTEGATSSDHDVALVAGAGQIRLAQNVDALGAGTVRGNVLLRAIGAAGAVNETAGRVVADGLVVEARTDSALDVAGGNDVNVFAADVIAGGVGFTNAHGFQVATATVTAPGSSTMTRGAVTTAGASATDHDIGLAAIAGNLTLAGDVAAGSGGVLLRAAGTVAETTGRVAAGGLLVEAGDATLNTATNNVTVLAVNVATGNFAYTDTDGLTVGTTSVTAPGTAITGADSLSGSRSGIATAGGSVTLATASGELTIAQDVNAGAGSVALTTVGGVTQAGGTLTAASLTMAAGGDIVQTGGNVVAGTASFAAAGHDIVLTSVTNDFSTSTFSATGANVSVVDASAIGLGDVTATGTFHVAAGGDVTQTVGTAVVAGTAAVDAGANAITLGNAGNDFGTFSAAGGAVSVRDANAIVLGATAAASLAVTAGGAITQSGALTVTGATSLNAGAGNDITLAHAGNDFGSISIVAGRNVTLHDGNAIELGASTVSGTLDVTAGGAVTQSGALLVSGATTVSAGGHDIALTDPSNDFSSFTATGGTVAVRDANALVLGTTAATNLTVAAGGAVTQSGALAVSGTTAVNAAGQTVTLTDAANDFVTFRATGGDVSVHDANAVVLGATTVTGTLAVTAGGSITQSGAVVAGTLTGSAGGAATLTNGGNDVGTLSTFSTGTGFALADSAGGLAVSGLVDGGTGAVSLSATSGAIALGADVTAATNAALDAATSITRTAGTVSGASMSLTAGSGSIAADISTGTLTGSAGTNATLTGAVATLSDFTTGSGFSLVGGAGGLSIAGAVQGGSGTASVRTSGGALSLAGTGSVGGADVTLASTDHALLLAGTVTTPGTLTLNAMDAANGGVTQTGGTLSAGTLIAASGGAIVQTGGNIVASDASFDAGTHDIALTSAANDFGTSTFSAVGANVSVTDANAIGLGDIVASGTFRVTAGGDVTQTVGRALNVGTLTGSAGGAAILTNVGNDVATLGSFSAGTGFALADGAGGLAVAGPVQATSGDVAIATSGGTGLTTSGTIGTAAGNVALTSTDNAIALGADVLAGGATGTVTLSAADAASGTVTQSGGRIAAANLGIAAGKSVSLISASNDVATLAASVTGLGATLAYADADGFDVGTVGALHGVTTNNGDASLVAALGNLTLSQNLELGAQGHAYLRAAGGAVQQTGGAIHGAGLLVDFAANSFLNQAGNDVDTFAAKTVLDGKTLSFVDKNGFDIGNVIVTTPAGTAIQDGVSMKSAAGGLGADLSLTALTDLTPGNLTLSKSIDVGTEGHVHLKATGAVRQTGGALAAAGLFVEFGDDSSLVGPANNVATFAAKATAAGKSVSYADADGFTVDTVSVTTQQSAAATQIAAQSGVATLDGNLTLTASTGDLIVAQPISVGAGTASLTAATGNVSAPATVTGGTVQLVAGSTISANVAAGTLTGSAGADASITGAVGTLGTFATGSGFDLTDGVAGLTVAGAVTGGSGAVNVRTASDLALTGSVAGNLVRLIANGGSIALAGNVTSTDELQLIAGANIRQTAGVISAKAALSTLIARGGAINFATGFFGRDIDVVATDFSANNFRLANGNLYLFENLRNGIVTNGLVDGSAFANFLLAFPDSARFLFNDVPINPASLAAAGNQITSGSAQAVQVAKQVEELAAKGDTNQTPAQQAFSQRPERPNYGADPFQQKYNVLGVADDAAGRGIFDNLSYVQDGFWEGLLKQ